MSKFYKIPIVLFDRQKEEKLGIKSEEINGVAYVDAEQIESIRDTFNDQREKCSMIHMKSGDSYMVNALVGELMVYLELNKNNRTDIRIYTRYFDDKH